MARKTKIKSANQIVKSDGSKTSIDTGGGSIKTGISDSYQGLLYGDQHPVTPVPFPLPENLVNEITDEANANQDDDRFFREKGVYGFGVYAGFVRAAYTAELYWPDCIRTYNRMRRSDPEINIVRQMWTAWAQNLTGKWVEPDKPNEDEKKATEFANSVWSEIEGGETKLLTTIVNFVPLMGWGTWEFLPGLRKRGWRAPNPIETWESQYNDGLVGIREIAFRDPSTFWRWELDHWTQRLMGMWQAAYLSGLPPVFIPINDMLHLRYGDMDNPEGFALMEPIYRMERLKYGFEVIAGIGFEHSAGFLNAMVKKGKITEEDKKHVNKAARAIMSAQEGNYAIWPENVEGEVKDITFGSAGSLLEFIRFYSILKLTLFGMQYIAQSGTSGRGSYASVESSSSMATEMFNASMDGFATQVNDQIGKKLFGVWNKDAFYKPNPSTTFTITPSSTLVKTNVFRRPKYTIPPLDRTLNLTEIASFLTSLWGNLPMTEADFKSIRRQSAFLDPNLPADEDVIVGAQNTKTAVKSAQAQGQPPAGNNRQPPVLNPNFNSVRPSTPQEQRQFNQLMQSAKERLMMAGRR